MIVPVELINPAVNKLPPVILPFPAIVPSTLTPVGENTATLPTVLTDIVTLAFAAAMFKLLPPFTTLDTLVIIPVSCDPLPSIKLPVIFPVAETKPAVKILPCIALPVLDIIPAVRIFPPVIFAADVIVLVAEIRPAVKILPCIALPVLDIIPAVNILPCIALPVLLITPAVNIFPVVKLPIPPVMLPVVESVAAANVIVVTFDTVFIFIPLVPPAHGIIENPTLPIVGPVVNIAMSPFDCKLLNDPAEILGSIEIVFPALVTLNAAPVPCGAVSVIDTNVLTAALPETTTLFVIMLPPFILPVADINPAVRKFPPCMLPAALNNALVARVAAVTVNVPVPIVPVLPEACIRASKST